MFVSIADPITGEELTIYGQDENMEVYRCYAAKVVASIQREYRVDQTEAIRRLANSDIDNGIWIDQEYFWAE